MANLFKEVIPSILVIGQNILENEKDYIPYQINIALSLHLDTVLLANTMNINNHIPNKLQYDYLLNKTRHYKRQYKEWPKKYKPEDIDDIQEYYDCSLNKAKEYLNILSDEQIREIKMQTNKGGV